MQKRFWLLLLMIACTPIQQPLPVPEPIVEVPAIKVPAPVGRAAIPHDFIVEHVVQEPIPLFSLIATDAIYDNFSIIPVERYDALYQSEGISTLVHVFRFSSRQALEVVLNSEFYYVVNLGATSYQGNTIAVFLTYEDHRIVVWPSGTALVYVDTFIPDFAARQVIEAYLAKYPSDLEVSRCVDSDGDNRFIQGTTTRIQIGSTIIPWADTCLRDFAPYRNKQYTPIKGLNEEDGLLEGLCGRDQLLPGYIFEHICPRGCLNGVCKLS